MKKITLLGDIHGKYKHMHEVIRQKNKHEYIVALGDVGFSFETLDNVDPKKFVIVGGNHENYDKIINIPHYLGDYGYMVDFNGIDFFYYRGAYSIDRQYRTIGIDWWENEQVRIEDFMNARELYRLKKPDLVITHDCPQDIAAQMLHMGQRTYENVTSWALQELYNIHQPKLWFFGHWHRSKTIQHGKTKFMCLDELETYQLTKDELLV
jgi:predicted phosphodiesterase